MGARVRDASSKTVHTFVTSNSYMIPFKCCKVIRIGLYIYWVWSLVQVRFCSTWNQDLLQMNPSKGEPPIHPHSCKSELICEFLALRTYLPTYLPTYRHTYLIKYLLHTYIRTYIHEASTLAHTHRDTRRTASLVQPWMNTKSCIVQSMVTVPSFVS